MMFIQIMKKIRTIVSSRTNINEKISVRCYDSNNIDPSYLRTTPPK